MKTALITGANRGIGFETAKGLGALGYHILVGSRDRQKGEEAAASLAALGVSCEALEIDMASPASIEAAASFLLSSRNSLDVLVNNAGVWVDPQELGGSSSTIITQQQLQHTFQVNFFGVVDLTQRLLPLLKASPAARIVNLSSILGSLTLHADPSAPLGGSKALGYDSSKTALNAFSVHLAYDLRDTKIKVNSAHPGWIQTEMGGADAPTPLEEGAETSIWLATLPEDGPSGGYFHLKDRLPW